MVGLNYRTDSNPGQDETGKVEDECISEWVAVKGYYLTIYINIFVDFVHVEKLSTLFCTLLFSSYYVMHITKPQQLNRPMNNRINLILNFLFQIIELIMIVIALTLHWL